MKRLLLLLAVLSCPGWAAISAPTCVNGTNTAATTAVANQPTGLAVTAGDTIVVVAGQQTDSTTDNTITDGVNTYSASGVGASPSDGGGETQKWSKAIASTTTTLNAITATWGIAVGSSTIIACDIPGATNTEDGSINTGGVGFISTLTSSPFTTTNANDILLNSVRMSAAVTAPTPDTGYTIPTNGTAGGRHSVEYKIVAATQSAVTVLLSWTSTARASSSVMVLKASASGYTHPGSVVTRGGAGVGSNINDPACPATAVGSNVNGACP